MAGETVDLEVDEAWHDCVAHFCNSRRPGHIDPSFTHPGDALAIDQHACEGKFFLGCEDSTVKQERTHAFGTISGMFAPAMNGAT